jgi:hypothetical protein
MTKEEFNEQIIKKNNHSILGHEVETLLIEDISKLDQETIKTYSKEITILLTSFSLSNFKKAISLIDDNYPPISFHYVLQASQSDDLFFLYKIKLFQKHTQLTELFSPMRTRLMLGMLKDLEIDESYSQCKKTKDEIEAIYLNNENLFHLTISTKEKEKLEALLTDPQENEKSKKTKI